MKTLELERATLDLVKQCAIMPYNDTSIPLPNGKFEVAVSDDVAAGIGRLIPKFGFTADDVITRLCMERLGKKVN